MKIEEYAFGRIRIDGGTYTRDLILLPDRVVEGWWRRQGHLLQLEDLSSVLEAAWDALVIGTGAHGAMRVSPEVERYFARVGLPWEKHPTARACERYNALAAEGRRVAAALHLTC